MKRKILILFLLLLLVFLTACGGSQATDQPQVVASEGEEASTEDGATVKISFAYPGEESELAFRPDLIERFMELHPDIIVEDQPVPPDGYDTQLLASIAAGSPPDVFVSGDVWVANFISNGVAADLTPMFDADPDLNESDFYPAVLDFHRGADGHVYMIPDAFDVQRIYYNKDLFDAAGLDYPSAEWTWDDFKSAAAALTQGEGTEKTYGFYANNWWAVWLPYIWQNGGDLISADGTKCTLTEPEAVEALEFYADFIRQGYSPSPAELEGLGMGGYDLFMTGRAAMLQSGGWMIPEFEAESDFAWSMAVLPTGKQPATFFHLSNYVLAAGSKNKDAAWEFLKFLASEEVYTLEAVKFGRGVPPIRAIAENLIANPPSDINEYNLTNILIGQEMAQYGKLPTKILNWDEFVGDGVDVGMDLLWRGEATVSEATETACAVEPQPFSE